MVRFIELFKPLARFFPNISAPDRKVNFNANNPDNVNDNARFRSSVGGDVLIS